MTGSLPTLSYPHHRTWLLDEVARHGFELILKPVPFPCHLVQVTQLFLTSREVALHGVPNRLGFFHLLDGILQQLGEIANLHFTGAVLSLQG